MNKTVAEDVRQHCAGFNVRIIGNVEIGFHENEEIAVEESVTLAPGQVGADLIGAFTYLGGRNSYIRYVHLIGRFCSIAPNVMIGEVEHPTSFLSPHPLFQRRGVCIGAQEFQDRNAEMIEKSREAADSLYAERFGKIVIGNDVWIGEGALVRRGVEIGDGAVIAARAVVTKDVPPYAIVAGSPARVVRYRFAPEVIEELLRLEWWLYGLSALDEVDFTDIDQAVRQIDANIASGRAEPYRPAVLSIGPQSLTVYNRTDSGPLAV